jgi:hypothetical protein
MCSLSNRGTILIYTQLYSMIILTVSVQTSLYTEQLKLSLPNYKPGLIVKHLVLKLKYYSNKIPTTSGNL